MNSDLSFESSGSGPAVLFLHGLTFDRTMWRPIVDRLAGSHRCVAVDLPGHGDSPGWPAYDLNTLADGLHAAVTRVGLEPPLVVGHSMAALTATIYGARHPTRGIVNVDQSLEMGAFARLVQSLADQLRGDAFAAVWHRFAAGMHVDVLPPVAQELLASTSRPDQSLVLGYWREALERDPDELCRWRDDVLGQLRSGGVGYLAVSGDQLRPEYQQWLSHALPQARMVNWPGSGHFPHLAHPDRFARLLAGIGDEPHPDCLESSESALPGRPAR